jgi:sugar lactone lactonase YvrE
MFLAASEEYRRLGDQGDLHVFCGNIPQGEPDRAKSGYEDDDGRYFILRNADGKPLAAVSEDDEGNIGLLRFPGEWPSSVIKDVPEDEEE